MGGIDVVVDIVGDARWSHIQDTTNEEWDWVILNNLTQVKYVYTAALRHMIPQGTGGSLVSLSSVDGIGSSKLHGAYGAAKAGLIHLTKTYAEEVGRYGIRANTVAPGNVGGGVWDDPEVPFGSNPVNPLAAPAARHRRRRALLVVASRPARHRPDTRRRRRGSRPLALGLHRRRHGLPRRRQLGHASNDDGQLIRPPLLAAQD